MGSVQDGLKPSPVWDFFDSIFCITLDSRPDRMREAKQQLAAVGLEGRVEFFITHKDHDNPVRGIYQSHMHCLSKGVAARAKRILVFEDDIIFRGFNPQRLQEACQFLERMPRWNGFFLGCITDASARTACAGVRQVRYRCLAHGYALSRPFAQHILQQPWNGLPYDGLLQQQQADYFALSPMCAFQGQTESDNQTVVIDRLRTVFGGLPFIQQCNELYQNHKGLILVSHLLLAALTLGLLLLFFRS